MVLFLLPLSSETPGGSRGCRGSGGCGFVLVKGWYCRLVDGAGGLFLRPTRFVVQVVLAVHRLKWVGVGEVGGEMRKMVLVSVWWGRG